MIKLSGRRCLVTFMEGAASVSTCNSQKLFYHWRVQYGRLCFLSNLKSCIFVLLWVMSYCLIIVVTMYVITGTHLYHVCCTATTN